MSNKKVDIEEIIKKADRGDSRSQFRLGIYYRDGYCVERNLEAAVKWFKLAADSGDKSAQSQMGMCYYNGIGVEQNYDEAVKWFNLADDADRLVMCYREGHTSELDLEKIIEDWEEAFTTSRSHSAMLNLAYLYSDGTLMEPDYEKAACWWEEASWGDDGEWIHGHPYAQYQLACYYYEGKGVEKNEVKALAYFRAAISTFRDKNKRCPISNEPEYVINARRMLVKNGDKNMIGKIKRAANNGSSKAIEILEEFGIEIPQQKQPKQLPITKNRKKR